MYPYQTQQTFPHDKSVPTSPQAKMVPQVQTSETSMFAEKQHQMKHRRWKSDPDRTRVMVKPFSYEYKFEDGRLAGLAEYHPDQDYMHYSSSRSTSRTVSRNQSTRTSKEIVLAQPSLDNRKSSSSQSSKISQGPPSSPKKTDSMKWALSLHTLKRQASSEERRAALSPPYLRPEVERLAASFGPKGPQHITLPIQRQPDPKFQDMFELPRSAPLPPSRDISSKPEPPREIKATAFAPIQRKDSSHASVLPSTRNFSSPTRNFSSPRLPERDEFAPQDTAIITPRAMERKPVAQLQARRPPPLRRKTSKFIEHIERKEKLSPGLLDKQSEDIPPVPPMVLPPFEFELPTQGEKASSPISAEAQIESRFPAKKSPIVRFATESPEADEVESKPNTASKPPSILKMSSPIPDKGAFQSNVSLKRSASLMKSLPPTPGPTPKRSTSTRSRPAPMMGAVCMAQVKPVLTSPIVAKGHARMISC